MAAHTRRLDRVPNPALERPDPEVPAKPRRRPFSAAYQQRMLEEADRGTAPGQSGALLRREGLYASHLSTWRSQREHALVAQRRGRKATPAVAQAERRAPLEYDNEPWRQPLEQAYAMIEGQKKRSALLALPARLLGRRSWPPLTP